jgi:N-acetylmuramoyl-L-alanine amidase
VAGHFYIDRDGWIERWVLEDRIVDHVTGHNRTSVGIELVNRGRFPDWYNSEAQEPMEDYPAAQVTATLGLLDALARRLPAATTLVRHSDLDQRLVPATDDASRQVRRRIDPGPRFPWQSVQARWEESLNDKG